MGLDRIELLLEVEREFGVCLTGAEAGSCRTVGELYECLLSKLRLRPSDDGCPVAEAFFRLRRAMVRSCGVRVEDVRPDRRLTDLLSRSELRWRWRRLRTLLGQPLPPLRRPDWLRWSRRALCVLAGLAIAQAALCAIAGAAGLESLRHGGGPALAVRWLATGAMLLPLWAAACLVASAVLRRPLRTTTPAGCATLGELARHLAAQARAATPDADRTREQVWRRLCEIVAARLGAARNQLHRDLPLGAAAVQQVDQPPAPARISSTAQSASRSPASGAMRLLGAKVVS